MNRAPNHIITKQQKTAISSVEIRCPIFEIMKIWTETLVHANYEALRRRR